MNTGCATVLDARARLGSPACCVYRMDLTSKSHSFGGGTVMDLFHLDWVLKHTGYFSQQRETSQRWVQGEGVMPRGEELPSALLSSFNVVLVETSPTTPQHESGCEMV